MPSRDQRAYYAANRDRLTKQKREFRLANPDHMKDMKLRSAYGLSLSEFNQMSAKQNECCAICGEKGQLHVDHNHETGAIRGLLCGHCNRGIGMFKDDPRRMVSAIDYLVQHSCDFGVSPANLALPASKSDQSCSPFSYDDLARTISSNYASARANAEQLNALIALVRKAQIVEKH